MSTVPRGSVEWARQFAIGYGQSLAAVGGVLLAWALYDGPHWLTAGFATACVVNGVLILTRVRWAPEIHLSIVAAVGLYAGWLLTEGDRSPVAFAAVGYAVYAAVGVYPKLRLATRGSDSPGSVSSPR